MAVPFIQNSFAGGELAPQMWGRTDLTRYKSGLAVCRNFFVDYRGGVSTRAGTSFVGPCLNQTGPVRLIPFIFNTNQAYQLEFSEGAIRFIYRGAYVLNNYEIVTDVVLGTTTTIIVAATTLVAGQQVYLSGFNGCNRPNGVNGLNGRTLEVLSVTPNLGGDLIVLFDPITNLVLDSSTWTPFAGFGDIAAVYSIASPYTGADLFELKFTQSADVLDIAHVNYQPAQLKRMGAADWALVTINFGSTIQPPTGVTVETIGGPGGTDPVLRYNYCVTSISNSTGEESLISGWVGAPNNALNQDTGIANLLSWNAVAGTAGYKIYKALPVLNGTAGPPPFFVGYIGTTTTANFHDTNFEPDFTTVPPQGANPFQLGPIVGTTITNAGFGYISPTVQISDPTGSGAVITATADTAGDGHITGLSISNAGTNYSSPVLDIVDTSALGTGLELVFSGAWTTLTASSFSPAPGSITIGDGGSHYHAPIIALDGAIIDNVVGFTSGEMIGLTTGAVVTSLDLVSNIVFNTNDSASPPADALVFNVYDGVSAGQATATAQVEGLNNPGVVTYFDQRKVFAGSVKNPDTFWTSRVGLYNNFDTSFPSQAADALTESIVSSEVNIIQSLTPMSGGLIALTSSGAYQISGGTPGAPLTPTTVTSQAQAFSGANQIQPVRVNYDLLYVTARGSAVRDLTYNFYLNVYTGQDISAQSSHLFFGRTITQMAYAEEPYKIVWAVRDDGILLALTIMKEQEIIGWSRHDTCGSYLSVSVIPEDQEDVLYVVVQRWFNGSYYNVVERQASRTFGGNLAQNVPTNPEEAWCLDCANALLPQAANFDILYGTPSQLGILATPTVDQLGYGYSNEPVALVIDAGGPGQGGSVLLHATDGQITSATLSGVGAGYVQPEVDISDSTGRGARVSVGVQNIWVFYTDYSGGGSPPPAPATIGDIIRCGGGYGIVIEADPGASTIYANMLTPPSQLLPNAPGQIIMRPQPAGTWSLSTPVSAIGGLDQFTGTYVGIVADGNVLPPQLVVDGCISLPAPATYVIAGALFTAQVQTLPFSAAGEPTDQGRRKDVAAVTLRTVDTRGIAVGNSWDDLVAQKERTDEQLWLPTQFTRTGGWQPFPYPNGPISPVPPQYEDIRTALASMQDEGGYVCILQTYPMPCTVLAEMPEVAMGDTPSP